MYLQRLQAKHHTHKYFVDPETNETVCICGKIRGGKRAAPGQFNAIRCRYNGYWYDSKFEASAAMKLDWELRAGKIKGWDRQFTIELQDPGRKFTRRHKIDFRVHHNDGSFELIETKGFETDEFKSLKRLIERLWLPEHLEYSYTVVK